MHRIAPLELMLMRIMLLIGMLAVFSSTQAQEGVPNCPPPTAKCLGEALDKTDKELNQVYRLLVAELKAGTNIDILMFPEQLKSLVSAERAWVAYRDAQCDLEAAAFGFGSGTGDAQITCRIKMTDDRIAYLKGLESATRSNSNLCIENQSRCGAN